MFNRKRRYFFVSYMAVKKGNVAHGNTTFDFVGDLTIKRIREAEEGIRENQTPDFDKVIILNFVEMDG